MQNTKINIIILNWNGWQDTVECIESLKNTEAKELANIIVIDNGSSDESVYRLKNSYPDIELIQNVSNLGFSRGCNAGLLKSIKDNVDFVWLLNNDTKVSAGSLQALLNTANADSKTGIVGSTIYCMDAPNIINTWGGGYINFWTGSVKHIRRKKKASKLQYITGACMLIRVSALREVGVFDDTSYFMYWEDADLCRRFVQSGWRLAVAEKSTILHKESASFRNNYHLLVRYFNQSATNYFCKFYRFCAIPVFVGMGGRMIMRLIRRDYKGFKEILAILWRQFYKPFGRLVK